MRDWIPTYTGRAIDPVEDPRPESICIEDIAHSLSSMARWNGAAKKVCTVAEHSVIVSRDVRLSINKVRAKKYKKFPTKTPIEYRQGLEIILVALLHDSGEAYLPDCPKPYKSKVFFKTRRGLEPFAEVEKRLFKVILEGLGYRIVLDHILDDLAIKLIKESDERSLMLEANSQINKPPGWSSDNKDQIDWIEKFDPLGQVEAESLFLNEYLELRNEIESFERIHSE